MGLLLIVAWELISGKGNCRKNLTNSLCLSSHNNLRDIMNEKQVREEICTSENIVLGKTNEAIYPSDLMTCIPSVGDN